MPVKIKGFSLLETLIALAISSGLLLGAVRMLPALHFGVLRQTQQAAMQEELWQLAFAVGKQLQRAGYCYGSCSGEPLKIASQGQCVIIQWDANSNGKWETFSAEAEQTGYRLREKSLETQRGATQCDGKGWEKITDPQKMRVDAFVVKQQARSGLPPLMIIRLAATPLSYGGSQVNIEHSVVGYNL